MENTKQILLSIFKENYNTNYVESLFLYSLRDEKKVFSRNT